jgi:hypothetical protein
MTMATYVDDARIPARVGRIMDRWSHLTADDKPELHTFAKKIGLQRSWFQDKPRGLWHYDVTERKRREAVAADAVEISWRDREVWTRPGRDGRPAPATVPGITPGTAACCGCPWVIASPAGDVEHQAHKHSLATGHATIARAAAGGAR